MTGRSRDERLAIALADAALAGPWTAAAIGYRMSRVVAWPPSRLGALVIAVIAAHPRPPADRPRELAAFVLACGAFERAVARARATSPLPKPALRFTAPTATVRQPFHTPRLDTAADLAAFLEITVDELITAADTRLRARRARSDRIHHYRYRWLDRPSGPRLLEAARPRLGALQRTILDRLLRPIPVHPACHGFVAGRSAVTGARPHLGADVVLGLDLEHFFASVTAGRVWGVFRAAGFPESVAHLLAGLTTHATPVRVLAEMPPGPDSSRSFRLRRRLAAPHLPQGVATSPLLANLVLYSLDRRLDALAASTRTVYTRYADDLTFSGGRDLRRIGRDMITTVARIASAEDFAINPAKSRIRMAHQRQQVTGIVVNQRPNIPRQEYDRLKAILHDCRQRGPAAANREGHEDFRAHLLGRISWFAAINPDRGAGLRERFERIDWQSPTVDLASPLGPTPA